MKTPRLPSPQQSPQTLMNGHRGVPKPAERHNLSTVSWLFHGLSPCGHSWNTSPSGIWFRCPNYLKWILLLLRTKALFWDPPEWPSSSPHLKLTLLQTQVHKNWRSSWSIKQDHIICKKSRAELLRPLTSTPLTTRLSSFRHSCECDVDIPATLKTAANQEHP